MHTIMYGNQQTANAAVTMKRVFATFMCALSSDDRAPILKFLELSRTYFGSKYSRMTNTYI
jgi:hypothetical protein